MKHLIALFAAAALVTAAHAQTTLIGGVGFDELEYEAVTYDHDFNVLGSAQSFYSDVTGDRLASVTPASYNSLVRVYWDGTHGSSNWGKENNLNSPGDVGGFINTSTVGESITRSDPFGAPVFDSASVSSDSSISPQLFTDRGLAFNVSNGFSFSISIDASGYSLSSLAFAAFTSSSDITISWGLWDGTSVQTISGLSSVITGSTMTAYSLDLSSLNLTGSLDLVATLSGANGVQLNFDNLQVQGSAIPEPSTYAAILGAVVLGFVLVRRRQAVVVR
jgi:hypothetical protein